MTDKSYKLTIEDLKNLQELIQDDVICILDGFPELLINTICDAIVKRINQFKA